MKTKVLAALFGLSLVLHANQTKAQGTAAAEAIVAAVRTAISAQSAESTLLRVAPFVALTSGNSYPSEVVPFDTVPAPSQGVFSPSANTLLAQLKLFDQNIEIITPVLTAPEQASYNAAYTLLYQDSAGLIKAETYRKYLDFEEKHNEITKKLIKTTNTAERSNLQSQLISTDQNWSVFGKREEIASALQIVGSFSSTQTKGLYQSWKKTLDARGVGDYANLWDAVANTEGWITLTVTPQSGKSRIERSAAGTAAASIDVGLPSKISFRFQVFDIPRQAFSHPFLRASNWRNSRSYILSDGSSADLPTELVPRLVSKLILVKDIQFNYSAAESAQAVSMALKTADIVKLDDIPLKGPNITTPFIGPKFISSSQPFIAAVLAVTLPRLPANSASAH